MAERVLLKTCVIPGATTPASPLTFPMSFQPSDVERIDVRIPPGPSGLVGFYIGNGGAQFIPEGNGNWIVADNDFFQWPLSNAPNNGNWSIVAYNTDVISHTIYVMFNISGLTVMTVPDSGSMIGL